ncbi:acetoin utilization deacetylase AcuC-like enzyme [Tamilnaduibacter salinus]|uniref:Acetoin utilization deacetylase AcuC-like enzyme n=1 Tax=Tamilnaduibacter salinus TaxID=1484056 RepID=A0A2A2I4C3_9GAMM|nr:histone deacetylase family protein [Tamilnaduibacter salinus]PAV25975.1 acetylpolyamine amidohydrolase [Tamilnaduibacter salinus]PVY76297.1 acetoin utilization deacetylase AcuC-like enzyme [Tamilnaduibacter salinus]
MKAFFHPAQDQHNPQSYFTRGQMRSPQEVPDRTREMLKGLGEMEVDVREPCDQGPGPIAKVHDLGYLRFLESAHDRWPEDWGDEVMSNIFVRSPNALKSILAEAGRYQADGSCPIGAGTWNAAYWSAQSALGAADALMAGDRLSYAISRPPGHHARRDAAGGFCYLNNAAIAAEAMIGRFPKIAILDTDMHHGQGIQEIFYDRDDVLYVSVHGDPTNFYPVTSGYEEERGEGRGEGYNVNLPMPHGASEEHFFETLEKAMAAIRLFEPDALILTLGFDIYKDDPQAKVSVTTDGFNRLGRRIHQANLPTLVVQEGGYDLEHLSENLQAFLKGLDD